MPDQPSYIEVGAQLLVFRAMAGGMHNCLNEGVECGKIGVYSTENKMEPSTLIGILIVIPIFYLIGRRLNSLDESKTDDAPSETTTHNRIKATNQKESMNPMVAHMKRQKKASQEIITGVVMLFLFLFFSNPLMDWADMKWEDGWVNIIKLPFAFLFGIAPVVLLLWVVGAIALIWDGYKAYNSDI